MTDTIRLSHHLDTIRKQKKMTTDTLCENICSPRQYRRYLSGDSLLQHDRIFQFCDKMGITIQDFYTSFNKTNNFIYNKLHDVYVTIYNYKAYDNAIKMLDEINMPNSTNVKNIKYYQFVKLSLDYFTHKISQATLIDACKSYINTYQLITVKRVDFVDTLYVKCLLDYTRHDYPNIAADLMYRFITPSEEIEFTGISNESMQPFYANLAQFYYVQEQYEKSNTLLDIALKKSIRLRISDSLPWLYYFKMLYSKKMHLDGDITMYALKCLASCIATFPSRYEEFSSFIAKDLNINIETILPQHEALLADCKKIIEHK